MAKKTTKPIVLDMNIFDERFNDINFYINNKQDHYDLKHTHCFYEFTFIVNGSILNIYDDNISKLTKNDFLVLKPECIHQLVLDKNNDYTIYNFEVKEEFLSNILFSFNVEIDELLHAPLTYLHFSNSEATELIQLFTLLQNQTYVRHRQFYLKLILVKYLTKLVTSNNITQVSSQHSETINIMLNELNSIDNFPLSCSKIASKLGYSHEYLIRLFKRAGLDTPNKVFLKNKLNHATMLLANSKIKIVNIAELCGIYSISYFNTAFKKEFGISPSQYRKKYYPIPITHN